MKLSSGHWAVARLVEAGFRYWTTALVISFVAVTGSSYVYDSLHLTEARSHYFQYLLETGPRPPEPKFVSIVLINDDEYWGGYPAGRRPIKRDYLAKLVDTLVAANAYLIALDIDAPLPDPSSMTIPEDYKAETDVLIRAILNAAQQGKKVVLATPISFDEQGTYRQDPDIYQPYGLCNRAGSSEARAREPGDATRNVTCGHIALPNDPLVIPVSLPLANGASLDSFSLAIAKALRPEMMSNAVQRIGTEVRYGNYISNEKFQQFNALLSARAILQSPADQQKLAARAVIIGGNWSTFAAGRGPSVDLHWTPVGPIVGAMLHANFVEAFLDSRTFGSTSERVLRLSEIVFSLIAAAIFVIIRTLWGKVVAVIPLLLLLLLIQWAALHGFGVFFDAFVPLLGLGLHSLYERLLGLHQLTRATRRTKRV